MKNKSKGLNMWYHIPYMVVCAMIFSNGDCRGTQDKNY